MLCEMSKNGDGSSRIGGFGEGERNAVIRPQEPAADRMDFFNGLPSRHADSLPLKLEGEDFDLESTRFGFGEILGLELFGHAGPAFVDVAAEVEPPRRAGLRGRPARREEVVGTLRGARAGFVDVRHVLPETVAVHVCSNPVEMEQAMVAAVGDHSEDRGVEPRDDRLCVRKRPADGEVKRAYEQGRRAERQSRSSEFRVVADEVLDYQIVHQRVVHVTFEEFRDAVLFAVRANDDRPIRCLDSLAIRVPGNQGDPLAGEVGQQGRGHVAALPPDEDQPVLEIRLRVNQNAFALRVLPEGRASVELAAQQ